MVNDMYIVDRIEEDIVVLEYEGRIIELDKGVLPDGIKDGDVLINNGEEYIIDIMKTKDKKDNIRNMFDRLKCKK